MGQRKGRPQNSPEQAEGFRPVSVAVCLLPALLGGRFWPDLPPRAVLAWAEGAEVPRGILCFGFPLLLALLQGLASLLARRGRYADIRMERLRQAAARWFLPVISEVLLSTSILNAANVPLPVSFWILSAAGFLLLCRGCRFANGHGRRTVQAYDLAGLLLLICGMLTVPRP